MLKLALSITLNEQLTDIKNLPGQQVYNALIFQKLLPWRTHISADSIELD